MRPLVMAAYTAIVLVPSVAASTLPHAGAVASVQQTAPVEETEGQSDAGTESGTPAPAGQVPTVQDANAPSPGDRVEADEDAPPAGGQSAPPIAIGPTSQKARVRVQVALDEGIPPAREDFAAGQLASPQHPDMRITPKVRVLTDLDTLADRTRPVTIDLEVSGLVPFGEMTVPLLYRNRQIETLRFQKAGLTLRENAESPVVALQKDGRLLLVLENPSDTLHQRVGVRLRFQGADTCTAVSDQPTPPQKAEVTTGSGWRAWLPRDWEWLRGDTLENVDCADVEKWSRFDIRPASQASLWIPVNDAWFIDRLSRLAQSTTRHGVVTLRYFDDQQEVVGEQNLPLQLQFEPTTFNLGWSIAKTGLYLLMGAVLYLMLRVSIPNYRRKKAIKDVLNEARASTATISDALDSQLRALLRVERVALDQRRRDSWVLSPGFTELAARIEAGVATLARKIDFARRLDAASCRRDSLLDGPISPTRLEVVNCELSAACDALKSDQVRDAGWLFVQQRLDAAEKALSDPSPEEQEAIDASLSRRWQIIRDHFGLRDGNQPGLKELVVPSELAPMAVSFPRGALLPRADDPDGRKWVAAIGAVRADLQLSALERLRDVQFLAPEPASPTWLDAMSRLAPWLSTPSIDNLTLARECLRELSEPATVDEIVSALQEGRAEIEMDPQVVGTNQTVKLSVRFLDPRLNSANLRHAIQCEWTFTTVLRDAGAAAPAQLPGISQLVTKAVALFPRGGASAQPIVQRERGWTVFRYFEPGAYRQTLSARFLRNGRELPIAPDVVAARYSVTFEPNTQGDTEPNAHDRWLRLGFQTLQMLAALLVPLATLAITTAGAPTVGRWWDLVAIGFGSEAIRSILTTDQPTSPT